MFSDTMFETDIYNTKATKYFFIPNGHKNGRDVFMPAKKVKMEDLPHPLIRLDYEGPPLHGSNRYRMFLSCEGDKVAPPVGSHIRIDETFEEAVIDDVIPFLKKARKHYDKTKSSNA